MSDYPVDAPLGFNLPGPGYVFGVVFFSLLGWVAWRHGRRAGRPLTKWLGLALMLYPYGVGGTLWLYVVGLLLCVGIGVDQRR